MRPILPLIALSCAAPLHADDGEHALRVVNDGNAAINQLFVSSGHAPGWRGRVAGIVGPADDERDRLEARMLPRSGSIVVKLKGGRCRYDIRVVLENGQTYVGDDVDICADGTWTVSRGRRR